MGILQAVSLTPKLREVLEAWGLVEAFGSLGRARIAIEVGTHLPGQPFVAKVEA